MWKFCGKAQFPHSFGRFAETVSFRKTFAIVKEYALNVLRKDPLNHLGILDALPEVIAEEANTFVAQCYGAKNSVNMAEIGFVYSTKFIL